MNISLYCDQVEIEVTVETLGFPTWVLQRLKVCTSVLHSGKNFLVYPTYVLYIMNVHMPEGGRERKVLNGQYLTLSVYQLIKPKGRGVCEGFVPDSGTGCSLYSTV